MANKDKNLITIDIFNRIFNTIHWNLRSNHFSNIHKSCSFFSVIGASILNMVHGIKAQSISGAAAFDFGLDAHLFLSSSSNDDYIFTHSDDGFHSWVEADGWFIDFTSPLLPEIAAEANLTTHHRRMLQRPIDEEAESPYKLSKTRMFYLSADQKFTLERVDFVLENPKYMKIVMDCIEAYSGESSSLMSSIRVNSSW